MGTAKDDFGRPRPFVTEPRLAPIVAKPPSASYPSGHTTWAVVCAIVLADMLPERRAQIFARADEYATTARSAGVHYPSDVAAGHLAGTALATELFHSPRFVADEVAAAAELRQALGLPALPRPRYYLTRLGRSNTSTSAFWPFSSTRAVAVRDLQRIARRQRRAVGRDAAAGHLHIRLALRCQRQLRPLARR